MKNIKSNEKQGNLLKQLKSAQGIQAILDTAYELLGNPINMFDLRYKLLAHTQNRVLDDPLWNEFIASGTFSHETVNFFNNEKFISAYTASPVALMKSPKLKYDRANGAIFGKDGLQLGNICVVACYKPFADEDFKLMETVAKRLADEIEKTPLAKQIPNVFEETNFRKLIDGTANQNTLSKKEIEQLHQGFKNYIYVAVVDIIQFEETLTHLVYFKDLFQKFNKDFQYFIYLNNIVILFSTDKPVLNAEKELAEFNSFFSQNSLFAGISSGFHSLLDLKTYFKEALNALNYGMCLNSGKNIFSYDTFKIELFVNSRVEDIDISYLCHPILFSIRDYDNKNNTEYTEILYNLFISGLDHCYAAKKMYIECEKFDSLLNKATILFQIDWNDGNMLFSLFRSLKFFKCFPEKFLNLTRK